MLGLPSYSSWLATGLTTSAIRSLSTAGAKAASELVNTFAAAQVTAGAGKMEKSRDAAAASAQQMQAPSVPAHHVQNPTWFGPRFTNPWGNWQPKSFSDMARWQRERKKLGVDLNGHLLGVSHPTAADFQRAFPVHPVDWEALNSPAAAEAVQAVWVGHATALVRMAGATFITDPVLSERCSPVQFMGPKRLVPPALQANDPGLQKLDFVLISHNHYDHLDANSVDQLHKRFGSSLTWYVPLRVGSWFASRGIKGNVVEMDWWQEAVHPGSGLKITMTPAVHWSARGLFDRLHTLWGGFHVRPGGSSDSDGKEKALSFWFAGDTAYQQEPFKEIGRRLGPIDLAAIPIGAYAPRWFMKTAHANVEDALQIASDVGARRSVAIHCCTFALTDEALDEPPTTLVQSLAEEKRDPWSFVTLQHGERLAVAAGGQLLNSPKLLGSGSKAASPRAAAAVPQVDSSHKQQRQAQQQIGVQPNTA